MLKLLDNLRMMGRVYPHIKNDAIARSHLYREMIVKNPEWSHRELMASFEEMPFAEKWVKSGEIVFCVSHSLAALFALTTAPEIDWNHLPHEGFVIQVPRKLLPVNGHIDPEWTYIYVSDHQAIVVSDYDTTAQIIINYGTSTRSADMENINATDIAARWRNVDISTDDTVMEEARAMLLADKTFQNAPPDVIEKLVISVVEARQKELRDVIEATVSSANKDTFRGMNVLVNRFVSNVLAYRAETGIGTVLRKRDEQRAGTLVNLLPPVDVVVTRTLRDAALDAVQAALSGSIVGVRRAMRHHVRGHWRNQAHGVGRTERKRLWIYPHARGDASVGSVVRRIENLQIPGAPKVN